MKKEIPSQDNIVVPDHLFLIARMIKKDWKNINHGAVPYLKAMDSMSWVRESYGMDSGDSIVRYFLANATTWRGPVAKAVKAKLNQLLKTK